MAKTAETRKMTAGDIYHNTVQVLDELSDTMQGSQAVVIIGVIEKKLGPAIREYNQAEKNPKSVRRHR